MSSRAAFNDRAAWVDPRNTLNTYLHYYAYGEALALALDLELRTRFETDLDTLLRSLWAELGRPERPYTSADLERHLAKATSEEYARDFFARFVESGESPDYTALLTEIGWTLSRARPEQPWLGAARLAVDAQGVYIAEDTRVGTPLYLAGLGKGDRLLELGGRELEGLDDVERALRRRRPGDTVRLVAERRLEWLSLEVGLAADPGLDLSVSATATEEQAARRGAWLASQVEVGEEDVVEGAAEEAAPGDAEDDRRGAGDGGPR